MEKCRLGRDKLRDLFNYKLAYADVTPSDIDVLVAMLGMEFANHRIEREEHGEKAYWVRTVCDAGTQRVESWFDNGVMVWASVRGKGTYFEEREVITFNRDGRVGFCGDADMYNLRPVEKAFIKWCRRLHIRKGMFDEYEERLSGLIE